MNRALFCFVSAATLAATLAPAESLRKDHPLIGEWRLTLPDGECEEIYRFRRNGTVLVTSADEVEESEARISDQPNAKGFYKWIDKVTKDNGKKDCSGEVTEVGHESTNYIRLHPSGKMFVVCEQEGPDTCIGPFVRFEGLPI
jgi:hypothetical protein